MNPFRYLPALFSSLFRVLCFLFLRVVPFRTGTTVLPTLYLLHLSSWPFLTDSLQKNEFQPRPDKELKRDTEKHRKTHTRAGPLLALLFTLSSSRRLQLANIAINTLLLGAVAEFIAYPLIDGASDVIFTRVGAVYSDSAKIVVRYPLPNVTEHEIRVVWREQSVAALDEVNSWQDGPIVKLLEVDDWVNTVKLDNLWPTTSYEYKLTSMKKTTLSYPPTSVAFRTFPDPRLSGGTHFRFIVSSCATPNFPYVPFRGRTIKGFDLLARYLWPAYIPRAGSSTTAVSEAYDSSGTRSPLQTTNTAATVSQAKLNPTDHSSFNLTTFQHKPLNPTPQPAFLMFLGDFIYADVPVYFGDDKEAYRRLYRRNYQSPSYRKIYERLPVFHTYDDHEFINNFVGLANDSTPPFPNASDAFRLYNANANYDSLDQDQFYYDFRHGDAAFFVMDTRRYRSDIGSDDLTRTMLGEKQLAALYAWLSKVNSTATFKFIVTSVPFTSLWGHDAVTDAWAGFMHEKTALLDVLHSIPNVIILSGDRHEFANIEFNSGHEEGYQVREFSTSPMSMFYVPFFRTLQMRSTETVQRMRRMTSMEGEVNVMMDEIPKERVLKYIATGNSKWSAIEVDTRDPSKPMLRLEVTIDGSLTYEFTIIGTPVKLHSATALGAFVPQSFKEVLGRIGIKPSKWF